VTDSFFFNAALIYYIAYIEVGPGLLPPSPSEESSSSLLYTIDFN
jgi:hypothetical protein